MRLILRHVAAIFRRSIAPLALCVVSLCLVSIGAQDRLRSMPGYDQSQKMQTALQGGAAFVSGSITPSWSPDAQTFTYTHAGKTYRFEIATLTSTETAAPQPGRGGGRGGPGAEALNANAGRGARGRPPHSWHITFNQRFISARPSGDICGYFKSRWPKWPRHFFLPWRQVAQR